MPNRDSAVRRNIEPCLRGEKAPDLSLRVELGLKAGGEHILGLLLLDHRHILIHEILIFNNKISIRRIEISMRAIEILFEMIKTLQKVSMTR